MMGFKLKTYIILFLHTIVSVDLNASAFQLAYLEVIGGGLCSAVDVFWLI